MDSKSTLYEKFGGENTIAKVVDYFYELVLADSTVQHFFEQKISAAFPFKIFDLVGVRR